MNIGKIAGFSLIGLLWLWLVWAILSTPGGLNLKNLLIIAASGIIVFVPLWKKYFRRNQRN